MTGQRKSRDRIMDSERKDESKKKKIQETEKKKSTTLHCARRAEPCEFRARRKGRIEVARGLGGGLKGWYIEAAPEPSDGALLLLFAVFVAS